MKAFALSDFDSPPALVELPVPEVGPGQVRVRVKAASLNGIDAGISSGIVRAYAEYAFPVVIGRDAAGIVDAVGDGVSDVSLGDEVVGHVRWGPKLQEGTLAEHVVLSADAVAAKPPSVDFAVAAAIPLAGAAALAAVDAIGANAGETVLIAGASGGVGSFALQLATSRGATVIATGLPEDVDRLRALGAASVVDYREDVAARVLEESPAGVDALIDLVSFDPRTFGTFAAAVRKTGRVASTTSGATPEALAERGLTGGTVVAMPSRETIRRLLEEVERGALRVDVDQTLPLEDAGEGLERFATGHVRGKIVVTIGE